MSFVEATWADVGNRKDELQNDGLIFKDTKFWIVDRGAAVIEGELF